MKNIIIEVIVLSAFFLVLSEKLTIVNILAAIVIATAIIAFKDRRGNVSRYLSPSLALKWIAYLGILFFEVVKANFQVAAIALSKNMDVAPEVVPFESVLQDPWLLTILANSITLTPGTMTVTMTGNQLRVHCLNRRYAEGLKGMHMEKLLHEIEGELNE
ncbi:MAG: multicomponent Na+:H+ antiporter subunit [Clostridiales bacterium]|nr:multicomponent Na+:H+ antiporter subunit [Clostridiales bacterium]MDN5298590.1 multicomponent Na+:H+ antiporter subunit [Clostridiales bacterium]